MKGEVTVAGLSQHEVWLLLWVVVVLAIVVLALLLLLVVVVVVVVVELPFALLSETRLR